MASLTTLNIGGNGLGADGAKHIAAALPTMASLTTLDIRGNGIPKEDVEALSALCASKGVEAVGIEDQGRAIRMASPKSKSKGKSKLNSMRKGVLVKLGLRKGKAQREAEARGGR